MLMALEGTRQRRVVAPGILLGPGYADHTVEKDALSALGAELVQIDDVTEAPKAIRELQPQIILTREARVDSKILRASQALRGVIRYGVGVDNVDCETARELGVYVANIPDYGAQHEVSDHAVALYLAINRRLLERDRSVRSHVWGNSQALPIPGRRSATLGLLGLGKIARAVNQKFRALGFSRVLAHDPMVGDAEFQAQGVERASVHDICQTADVVSLHVPLTSKTRNILGRQEIGMFGPNTILINVARGGLVDEAALAQALQDQRMFGAGIDVFDAEPPEAENPLFTAPRCILSDHNAWYSEHAVVEIQEAAAKEIRRILKGLKPENCVND